MNPWAGMPIALKVPSRVGALILPHFAPRVSGLRIRCRRRKHGGAATAGSRGRRRGPLRGPDGRGAPPRSTGADLRKRHNYLRQTWANSIDGGVKWSKVEDNGEQWS